MTKEELDEIEEAFYSEVNYEDYNLAEWSRLNVPELIRELRKRIKEENNG